MFYFPCISSSFQVNQYKKNVKRHLYKTLKDLHLLISWEETYIRESLSFTEPKEERIPESQGLLEEIKKMYSRTTSNCDLKELSEKFNAEMEEQQIYAKRDIFQEIIDERG
jgi:predicted enzyme involved in methoxymalonyl-ACP biosynthesis